LVLLFLKTHYIKLIGHFLGLAYITAGVSKLFVIASFSNTIRIFRMIPTSFIEEAAIIIIIIEIILGLLFFSNKHRTYAASLSCLLLLGFIALSLYSKANGIRADCSCFSFIHIRITSLLHYIQNIILLVLSLLIIRNHLIR